MLDPHLDRAQDVPGRMQRDADATQLDRLTVGQRRDLGRFSQPRPEHGEPIT